MSQQQPAQPKSVLRGHRAQVHVTTFVRGNQRLASGDADGFVVLWDLTIMRPRAVWQAHTNAILGIADWGDDKIITHGRDNRLVVWKLGPEDEVAISTALPLDASVLERPQPWILHILEVNTMNFCSFAHCNTGPEMTYKHDELLIAVPNTLKDEAIDIFQLPTQNRVHTVIMGSNTDQKGMVMSVRLFWLQGYLTIVAGYESGLAVVARQRNDSTWDLLYRAQVHSQPVLSLDLAPQMDYFLTSGADAAISKHPIPTPNTSIQEPDLLTRADNKGVVPASSLSLVSATLSPDPTPIGSSQQTKPAIITQPVKIINTKHSGQQSLRIRSDGKIFATAGWDSKVRVYSAKTMSELAVLKWHEVGCYSIDFAMLDVEKAPNSEAHGDGTTTPGSTDNHDSAVATVPKPGQLSVKDRRIKMAKEAHWVAAGSKDGKISLWDIY